MSETGDLPPTPESEITIWDVGRPNVQDAVRPFRAEWRQHDFIALKRLTAEQRRTQKDAREMLLRYVLAYYSALDDVDETPPEWESVAAMVDLLNDMLTTVVLADDDAVTDL